jgi:hypothetical protein
MQRLIARFLVLFALAGNFIPLALAATAAPPHACCVRKSAHKCHTAAAESDQLTIRAASCCRSDSSRAVITSQYATPQPRIRAAQLDKLDGSIADSGAIVSSTQFSASHSTRAPPAC